MYSHRNNYDDEELSYNLRRISLNLRDRGYISDARRLADVLETLKARFAVQDLYAGS